MNFNTKIIYTSIFMFLIISLYYLLAYLKLPHYEWGLITTVVLFTPLNSDYFTASVNRIIGTAAFLLIGILIGHTPLSDQMKTIVASIFYMFSCLLAIRHHKRSYAYVILALSIAIFILPNMYIEEYTIMPGSFIVRLEVIMISSLLTSIPLLLVDKYLLKNEIVKMSTKEYRNYVEMAFIVISNFSLLYIASLIANNITLQGLIISSTALIAMVSNAPAPRLILRTYIKSIILATVFAIGADLLIPNIPSSKLHVFGMALFYGCIMYLILSYQKYAPIFKLSLIFTPILFLIIPKGHLFGKMTLDIFIGFSGGAFIVYFLHQFHDFLSALNSKPRVS